jgi:hypothetical protein
MTKRLPAKFEAEVRESTERITKKTFQVDRTLCSQREHCHQFEHQALQARHAQEKQLLQDLLDAVLAQQDPFSRGHSTSRMRIKMPS